ncbi:MAG TPA: hypothetical protein VM287_11085 [Egibacteraceae bacterium]|nr:hypothetical protein [Egibacteraceae bacterium]
MSRDLGQWLHDTAVAPSDPVDPGVLIARGRRRRRVRRTVAVTGSIAGVALVGLLVVGPLAGPPQVVLEPAPGEQESGGDGDAGAAFVPPSRVDGDVQVLALRFPDGVSAEIAYPTEVDLHERGATPGGVLSIVDGSDETTRSYGRARVSRPMEAHRGDRAEVLRRLNDGETPKVLAEYDGPADDAVPLVSLLDGDYLAWQAGGWTVLVPDRVGGGQALSDADRARYAAHVHPGEDAGGWLIVRADPPLDVEQTYVFLGEPDAAVEYARNLAPQPEGDADRVVVHASACTTGIERFVEAGLASWCDLDTQLSFDVAGADDVVEQLAERLQARAADYPPELIDPTWNTEEDKEAWQAEHGEGTWVVGYFYPPDFDFVDYEQFSEALQPRWKRLDNGADLDRQGQLAEALAAMTGPPPPRLATAWQGRELHLQAVHLDGTELVLDFTVLLAAGEGSTGGAAMAAQFNAVVFHHYPEAESICVLLDGEPSTWLHDAMTCP